MMKRALLTIGLSTLWLSGQTPQVLTPVATGVSETFDSLARQNAITGVLNFGAEAEEETKNKLYILRGQAAGLNAPASRSTPLSVSTAASTMVNQTTNGTLPVTVGQNFVGLGDGFNGWAVQGLVPPDTTLAVGPTQIVQWVNVKLAVFSKTGTPLLGGSGYVNGNQVFAGLGASNVCATTNSGDPVLQYDRLGGRWVLSQFAIGNATSGPFALCIAVSKTNDATGAYNLYQYTFNVLPDYPKLGVWTDAYYMTTNDFTNASTSGSFAGSRVCAFDKTAMMAGTAATAICFSGLGAANGGNFAMIPGDFEGTIPPPANTAAFLVANDWFTKLSPPYILRMWRMKPDFVTPALSTLTDGYGGAYNSFVSLPFDSSVIGACGDSGGACVPQPGTTRKLDTLSYRAMYRLAYRNLGGGRESLVFTGSVDPAGGAVAGIQLLEIRNPGANPPQVFNNVVFNPDTTNRWMGSAATDKLGNVGMGYSVASAALSPGIRIAGRLRNDLRNQIRGELNVVTGAGNQTTSAQRWGDYSTMQIDPADDCTFWFTTQYTTASNAGNWATRIVGFKFNNCQ